MDIQQLNSRQQILSALRSLQSSIMDPNIQQPDFRHQLLGDLADLSQLVRQSCKQAQSTEPTTNNCESSSERITAQGLMKSFPVNGAQATSFQDESQLHTPTAGERSTPDWATPTEGRSTPDWDHDQPPQASPFQDESQPQTPIISPTGGHSTPDWALDSQPIQAIQASPFHDESQPPSQPQTPIEIPSDRPSTPDWVHRPDKARLRRLQGIDHNMPRIRQDEISRYNRKTLKLVCGESLDEPWDEYKKDGRAEKMIESKFIYYD
jgi:hypothetical protein